MAKKEIPFLRQQAHIKLSGTSENILKVRGRATNMSPVIVGGSFRRLKQLHRCWKR